MKKTFLLTLFILSVIIVNADNRLMYEHVFAPSEGFTSKVEKPIRKEICLNGSWDFQAVPLPADYKQGSGNAPVLPQPSGNWDNVKIKIPSPWNINAFANRDLEGPDHRNYPSYPKAWENVLMAWMKKNVTIPADWNNDKIVLHFEAVAGFAEVYVNGTKVAENFDIFLPFDADITSVVKAGETAEILVGVRSQKVFEDNSTLGRRIIPAGSMWGYFVNGIWQDVYLLALPKININDIFVKPLVSKGTLELEVTIENTTAKNETLFLSGDVREWINNAGTDVHTAPVSNWDLARTASLNVPRQRVDLAPGQNLVTIQIPVKQGDLSFWTPEFPNLYGLTLNLATNKAVMNDVKYVRFGWREWTIEGTNHLLNGKVTELRGDSWHFMGVPQLTRRYPWAWYTALKDANANAVRPHAQIYPRFYMEIADELGICVMAETANWASDGGPKLDSELFWENSKDHLRRMVLRDRNYASIFGWSISNENKPVILHVYNRPDLMPLQEQAWQDWRDIVEKYDPTRPWISADGEDDGNGILPTTVGHYGDQNSMKHWIEIGKPWGIGEHSMAYYGTPEQVSKYNGERAFESQLGRMEGIAIECYDLIAMQRNNGASYVSVFNLAWYSLQPLPFGKRDLTTPPTLADGIHFGAYKEGMPGVQPERMGPYCSTFNPGYDPTLPLYRPWPMFDAVKAANAGSEPAWSKWSVKPERPERTAITPQKIYSEIFFIGENNSALKQMFENHGVSFVTKLSKNATVLMIVDGKYTLSANDIKFINDNLAKAADIWVWSPTPSTVASYSFLPRELVLESRRASSFLPVQKSWLVNTVNSDFYFSEIQTNEASEYGMTGKFVSEGDILLNAANVNWRTWNKRPEELKTAAVLRSENEAKGPDPVFVRYPFGCSTIFVSTIDNFASTERGYNTLDQILFGAGIPTGGKKLSESLIDANGVVDFANLFVNSENNRRTYSFWVFSPRPLYDLLIEPDMPKLDIVIEGENANIRLNGNRLESLKTVPFTQGWNQLTISVPNNSQINKIRFVCENNARFVSQLQTSLQNPNK